MKIIVLFTATLLSSLGLQAQTESKNWITVDGATKTEISDSLEYSIACRIEGFSCATIGIRVSILDKKRKVIQETTGFIEAEKGSKTYLVRLPKSNRQGMYVRIL